jgi:DNA-binding NarL/FixJ family response regulator
MNQSTRLERQAKATVRSTNRRRKTPKRLIASKRREGKAVRHSGSRFEGQVIAAPAEDTSLLIPPNPRILLIDDHAVVRIGLRTVLHERFPGAYIVEAANEQEALDQAWKDGDWHLVFLDISMQSKHGLDLLKQLLRERPKLPVLVVSVNCEEDLALRAIRTGAAGYLSGVATPVEWVEAALKALAGGKYITPWLAEKMATRIVLNRSDVPHEELSDREFQVMSMIGGGRTVKEIAADISLSIKTISTYRTRVLEKLRLRNNAEVMRYCLQNGIVDYSIRAPSAS